jgi:hypothetical protein
MLGRRSVGSIRTRDPGVRGIGASVIAVECVDLGIFVAETVLVQQIFNSDQKTQVYEIESEGLPASPICAYICRCGHPSPGRLTMLVFTYSHRSFDLEMISSHIPTPIGRIGRSPTKVSLDKPFTSGQRLSWIRFSRTELDDRFSYAKACKEDLYSGDSNFPIGGPVGLAFTCTGLKSPIEWMIPGR